MTLRHRTNPALWADGERRSQGNAFDTTYVVGNRGDWRKQQFNANSTQRSSSAIERRRASGEKGLNSLQGNVR